MTIATFKVKYIISVMIFRIKNEETIYMNYNKMCSFHYIL
jgi:hypothetical protein